MAPLSEAPGVLSTRSHTGRLAQVARGTCGPFALRPTTATAALWLGPTRISHLKRLHGRVIDRELSEQVAREEGWPPALSRSRSPRRRLGGAAPAPARGSGGRGGERRAAGVAARPEAGPTPTRPLHGGPRSTKARPCRGWCERVASQASWHPGPGERATSAAGGPGCPSQAPQEDPRVLRTTTACGGRRGLPGPRGRAASPPAGKDAAFLGGKA